MNREEALEFIAQSVKSDVDMAKVADALKALEQEPILDKIRAELTEKRDILAKEAKANTINPLSCYGLDYALLIIDKYKAESEADNGKEKNKI